MPVEILTARTAQFAATSVAALRHQPRAPDLSLIVSAPSLVSGLMHRCKTSYVARADDGCSDRKERS